MPDPSPTAAAFAALSSALRADALASTAHFERTAAYLRAVERMAERYAAGKPLNDARPRKEG